ncbi:hypothetical protein Tco_0529702 [Tanacetum coccineum]
MIVRDYWEAWCAKAMAFKQQQFTNRLQSMTYWTTSSGLDFLSALSTITNSNNTWWKVKLDFTVRTTIVQILHQDVSELETQQHVQDQPATIADNVPNAMFDEKYVCHPLLLPSQFSDAEPFILQQYVDPSRPCIRFTNDTLMNFND